MVYYRKYRPQKIDDLDNAQVRETLLSILAKEPPHAFLFTGPKGLGKTSAARIIAKVVNCAARSALHVGGGKKEKKSTTHELQPTSQIEPCNNCDQCLSITEGTNLDVLEIDAASNRGIDEIRELKDKIRLAPVSAKNKIYIIDEVHMLTTEAFNALLKTLEEPPAHAMFILCTTEVHKVPATILSRCFHLSFKSATTEELIRSFTRIIAGEKIQIDDDALAAIAKLADGGFRDGTKILEEIVATSAGKKITRDMVEERYHVASSTNYAEQLVAFLQSHQTKEALGLVSIFVEQKIDLTYFLKALQESLHKTLLITVGVIEKPEKSELPLFTLEEIQILLQLFGKAQQDMKYAAIQQLPLELAIIEYGLVTSPAQKVVTIEEKTTVITDDSEVSVTSLRKKVGDIQRIKALYGETEKEPKSMPLKQNPDVELLDFTADGEITKEWMSAFWNAVINDSKTYNHTLAGVLRGCMVRSYDRKNLIIETAYKFHKEKLDHAKTMEVLEKVCKALTGNQVVITVELKNSR